MTIIVCGAGTMGSGIAETAVRSGFHTLLFDADASALENAKSRITINLEQLVVKKRISPEERNETLARLQIITDIRMCMGQLAIEAIVEKKDAKIKLFNQLAEVNDPSFIFATNTSSLSISEIALGTKLPGRVCGMHFFNPAQVMKLVEIVEGKNTDRDVKKTLTGLAQKMGKIPVTCIDAPGFIVNRVARHYYLEACKILESGIADVEKIDRILESSGFKLGPFRLMDLIGNDVNLAVSQSLYESCGRPKRFIPSNIQQEKVNRNELGRKTGIGFYNY